MKSVCKNLNQHNKQKKKFQRLMDNLETYPDAYIQYHTSDMQLFIDTNAAYILSFQKHAVELQVFIT